MLIMVTGPVGRFSGTSPAELAERLGRIATASLDVLKKGHVPVVGVYQAYPMIDLIEDMTEKMRALENSILGLAAHCGGLLVLGRSSGVNQEISFFRSKGLPVFESIDDLPPADR